MKNDASIIWSIIGLFVLNLVLLVLGLYLFAAGLTGIIADPTSFWSAVQLGLGSLMLLDRVRGGGRNR